MARGIVKVAGSLPLAEGVRGNVSDDPRVEKEFFQDRESVLFSFSFSMGNESVPSLFGLLMNDADGILVFLTALTYHGKLRASTGLSLLQGFTELGKKAEQINLREWISIIILFVHTYH